MVVVTGAWHTVRVFISSTFRDMQAERDHLVRVVFPRLRERLLLRRVHLVDVDLRWGVTSEQDASEVCREVIDECRPRFLAMLGGRYGTIPEGRDLSITADEIHFGALDRDREPLYRLFYFRHGAVTERMDASSPGLVREPRRSEKAVKLARLKRAIRGARCAPFLYRPRWDPGERRLLDLKAFGERVERDILATIDDELGAAPPVPLDEFAEERAAMEAFVEERGQRFVLGSRETVLNELLDHARATGGNGSVALTGAPGSGKSALLAHLSRHPALAAQPSVLLVSHFVGASPGSTDVRRTLRRLCHELRAGSPDVSTDLPDDAEKLGEAFVNLLRQACAHRRVVILLDAVDQFDAASPGAALRWLPHDVPGNARIILSALDGPALEELRRRRRAPREIELRALTAADGEAIIDQFRRRYRKQFEPDQRAALLAKTDAGAPLYLLVALEELRTLGTYEEISRRIAELPPTSRELFAWILERLERDDSFRDAAGRLVGRELVSRFAALLCASRYGLSQRELADLLDAGDPQGNVATLLHLLRPYLKRRGELLDFYHGQLRAAAREAWLNTPAQREAAHAQLAEYFHGQPTFLESFGEERAAPEQPPVSRQANRRKVEELVFQLLNVLRAAPASTPQIVRARDGLEQVLTDLEFVEAACSAGTLFDLEQDYRTVLGGETGASNPFGLRHYERLGALATFLERRSHILRSDPGTVLQDASNFQRSGHVYDVAREHLRRPEAAGYLWLRRIHRPEAPGQSPLQRTFKAAEGYLRGLEVSPGGEYAAARYGERPKHARGDEGEGTRLEMLHLADGRIAWTQEIAACAMTFLHDRDALRLVTGERSGRLRVWDAPSGRCLHAFQAGASVTALAASSGGGIVVSGHEDGKIGFWSAESGTHLGTVPAHRRRVSAVSFAPEGDILVSTGDGSRMLVWDSRRRTLLGEFEWYAGLRGPRAISPGAMALSFDARVLATGVQRHYGGDLLRGVMARIRLWDLEAGQCSTVLEGHEAGVTCLALSQDGRILVSSGFDQTWKVWDVSNGNMVFARPGRNYGTGVALTGDGRVALSGECSESLTLWETDSGRVLHAWNGPTDAIEYISITPDGNIAIVRSRRQIVIVQATIGVVIYQGEHDDDTCVFRIARDPDRKFRFVHASSIAQAGLSGWALNPDGRMALRVVDGCFEVWDVGRSARAAADASSWRRELRYRGFGFVGDRLVGVADGPGLTETDSLIWDVLENKPLACLAGERAREALFSIGGNATSVVTRDATGIIRIWRLHPLTCQGVLPGHMDIGFELRGDGDAQRAIRLDVLADLPLLLDDTGAGTAPDPRELHVGPRAELAVSRGASGMRIYHVPSCRRSSILRGKNEAREQWQFSDDGRFVVSGGFDEPLGFDDEGPSVQGFRKIVHFMDVRLWDRVAGACVQKCTGLEEDIAFLRADASLSRVLTGYSSGTIHLWRLEGRAGSRLEEREEERWAVSGDGRLLAAGKPGQPRFYDLLRADDAKEMTGRLPDWQPSPLDYLKKAPMVVAWCEASSRVIVSNWIPGDPDLGVFCLDSGRLLTRLRGHAQPAASILMSPSGDIAFSGGNDQVIRAWDVARGECLGTIAREDGWYRLVHAFQDPEATQAGPPASSGRPWLKPWRVVVHRTLGAFSVVDVSTGTTVRDVHRSEVIREDPVGVLPDGFSVLARTGNAFWIFDARTGEQRAIFKGHTDIVTACAFHSGARLAVSSQLTGDPRLWVWDLTDGRVLAHLGGHTGQITAVALSPDGRHALTGGADNTIRVWDLRARSSIRTLDLDGPVTALSRPLANGTFLAGQGDTSFLLQLCRGWPGGTR